MAVGIRISVSGGDKYGRALKRLTPSQNAKVKSDGLRKIALEVQRIAAGEKIIRGGKQAPHRSRLTSRTGTGRRSIRTNFSGLPNVSVVGSDLIYMAVHEQGGPFSFRASTVRSHTRRVAFGKRLAPFTVPSHTRRAHTARYPRRQWLEPAVDDVVPRKSERIMAEFWERQAGVSR